MNIEQKAIDLIRFLSNAQEFALMKELSLTIERWKTNQITDLEFQKSVKAIENQVKGNIENIENQALVLLQQLNWENQLELQMELVRTIQKWKAGTIDDRILEQKISVTRAQFFKRQIKPISIRPFLFKN